PHPKALARRINQSIDTYYPRAYYYKDFHGKARAVWSHIAVMAWKLPELARELEQRMFQFRDVWVDSLVRVDYPTKAFGILDEPTEDIIATLTITGLPALDLSFVSVMPSLAITVTQCYCTVTRQGIKDRRLDVNTRKVAFCLALGLLQAPVQDSMHQIRFYLEWMNTPIALYLVGSAADPEYKYDREACSRKILEFWERREIFGLLTQSFMMHVQGHSITDHAASQYFPTRLPMASLKNDATLPLPRGKLPSEAPRRINTFSSIEVWDTWYRAQVRELAAEIDRGVWVGYMVFLIGPNGDDGVIYDVPNVRFELGPKCESASGDAVYIGAWKSTTPTGHHRISGTFDRELDCLSVKFHEGDLNLLGWLTPMGIAGIVQSEAYLLEKAGYFWLWKREWANTFVEAINIEVPKAALKYVHSIRT
ncbi:hypothetical protein CMUS01_13756, partial [Colletotrichum musicola]